LRIIGCHECDAVVVEPFVPDGGAAYCERCGALLFRRHTRTVEVCFALVVAAAILFVVANAYPFLAFEMQGQLTATTLLHGVRALVDQGERAVAALVFLTTILSPACEIGLLLYVLGPVYFGVRLPGMTLAFRWVEQFRPWSMMEVFLIGILVAGVKLADLAEIVPGIALYAFGLLIPILAAASNFLDAEIVWRRIAREAS
jgi:paraquat-inducible protein A